MPDELEIITRVINEHKAIREHLKLTGDSIADREALASLLESQADFIPGRSEAITESHVKLQQAISSLEEGLSNHFAFEERVLPPFLGERLTQAWLLEHYQIRESIQNTKATVANINLADLDREQLLEQEAQIQHLVDNVRSLIEDHALREEAILGILQWALER